MPNLIYKSALIINVFRLQEVWVFYWLHRTLLPQLFSDVVRRNPESSQPGIQKCTSLLFQLTFLILKSKSNLFRLPCCLCLFVVYITTLCRSQRPRGLRHELSSPAQTLGSWVRIPLEAWMSVCVYSAFVLSCVQVAALRRDNSLSKESYRLCRRTRNWKIAAKAQQSVVEL
jgi:hypothetical protein